MADLHARLLAEIDRWQIPATHHAALRAAVELHAPVPLPRGGGFFCTACPSKLWCDCSTIRVIAEQLGIPIE